MLQINFPANRLVWHPFTPNMFIILRDNASSSNGDEDDSSNMIETVQIGTGRVVVVRK